MSLQEDFEMFKMDCAHIFQGGRSLDFSQQLKLRFLKKN